MIDFLCLESDFLLHLVLLFPLCFKRSLISLFFFLLFFLILYFSELPEWWLCYIWVTALDVGLYFRQVHVFYKIQSIWTEIRPVLFT